MGEYFENLIQSKEETLKHKWEYNSVKIPVSFFEN